VCSNSFAREGTNHPSNENLPVSAAPTPSPRGVHWRMCTPKVVPAVRPARVRLRGRGVVGVRGSPHWQLLSSVLPAILLLPLLGTGASASGDASCNASPGFYCFDSTGETAPCPAGQFSSGGDAFTCTLCPPGRYGASEGSPRSEKHWHWQCSVFPYVARGHMILLVAPPSSHEPYYTSTVAVPVGPTGTHAPTAVAPSQAATLSHTRSGAQVRLP
jgi:hypothetical protein